MLWHGYTTYSLFLQYKILEKLVTYTVVHLGVLQIWNGVGAIDGVPGVDPAKVSDMYTLVDSESFSVVCQVSGGSCGVTYQMNTF